MSLHLERLESVLRGTCPLNRRCHHNVDKEQCHTDSHVPRSHVPRDRCYMLEYIIASFVLVCLSRAGHGGASTHGSRVIRQNVVFSTKPSYMKGR